MARLKGIGPYGGLLSDEYRITSDGKIQWKDPVNSAWFPTRLTYAELGKYWDLSPLRLPELLASAEDCQSQTQSGNPGPVTLPHFDSCED